MGCYVCYFGGNGSDCDCWYFFDLIGFLLYLLCVFVGNVYGVGFVDGGVYCCVDVDGWFVVCVWDFFGWCCVGKFGILV